MATTIRNQKLFCTCCGGEFNLIYPIPVDDMAKKTKAFTELHKDCKQTWVEPEANQSKSIKERATWWIVNGETGLSSKTMWSCFMDCKDYPINNPWDVDDFSRCYKLLQAIPEWKKEIYKLKPLSVRWGKLVDNWDKLTTMYEANLKDDFKNWQKVGMGKFMDTLIY